MGNIVEDISTNIFLLSGIVGVLYFVKNHKQKECIKYLPILIIFLYGVETYAKYLSNHYKPNFWLYNFSTIVEISVLIGLVGKMYVLKKKYQRVIIAISIYVICSIINVIFFQGKTGFHTITYGVGSLLLIAVCVYYYYQLFLFPSQETLLKKPEFWIVTAILFSFTCGFPIFCLNNFYADKVSQEIWPIINITLEIINSIYYSLFIIAFLCNIKIKKYLPL